MSIQAVITAAPAVGPSGSTGGESSSGGGFADLLSSLLAPAAAATPSAPGTLEGVLEDSASSDRDAALSTDVLAELQDPDGTDTQNVDPRNLDTDGADGTEVENVDVPEAGTAAFGPVTGLPRTPARPDVLHTGSPSDPDAGRPAEAAQGVLQIGRPSDPNAGRPTQTPAPGGAAEAGVLSGTTEADSDDAVEVLQIGRSNSRDAGPPTEAGQDVLRAGAQGDRDAGRQGGAARAVVAVSTAGENGPGHATSTSAPTAGASAAAPAAAAPASAAVQTAPTAPTAPALTSQVIDRIGNLVQRDGTSRITIKLQPESLGEVRVVVSVRDGAVQVRMAGGDAAAQALALDAPELRRLLEQAGATDTRVQVRDNGGQTTYSSDSRAGNDQQQYADREARDHTAPARGTEQFTPHRGEAAPPHHPRPVGSGRISGLDLTM